jgi:hypothetical protein
LSRCVAVNRAFATRLRRTGHHEGGGDNTPWREYSGSGTLDKCNKRYPSYTLDKVISQD